MDRRTAAIDRGVQTGEHRFDMRAGLPILDMTPLLGHGDEAAREALARDIRAACRDSGFFYVVGHGVAPALLRELAEASGRFFALPAAQKQAIAMAHGGRAWRGWFPVGGELTGGAPDRKEGLYFGSELPPEHPRVRAGVPMHGANLFPEQVPELRPLVLRYIAAMTTVAQALLVGVARSLGLAGDYFAKHYTAEPTVLFRVFHYVLYYSFLFQCFFALVVGCKSVVVYKIHLLFHSSLKAFSLPSLGCLLVSYPKSNHTCIRSYCSSVNCY